MITIDGTLRTLSPLTVAAPGDLKISLTGQRARNGFPCTQVSRLSLPATGDMRGADVPVIPANTLRGGLRRAAAALIEEALVARGERIDLAALHVLRCGTPYGHPDKANPNLTEIAESKASPLIGVLGGGPRMVASALRVDTGMPVVGDTLDRGLVPLALESSKASGPITAYLWLRRSDDVATFVNHERSMQVVKDYGPALDAWQTLIGQQAESTDGDDDGEQADSGQFRALAGFNAFEVVLPGVTFAVRYDIDTDHLANIGFLLLALERFAQVQSVGGMKRLGYGRFALDLTVTLPDGTATPVFDRNEHSHSLRRDNPAVLAMIEAAEAWLAGVTAEQVHKLTLPSTTSRADVRKKLRKSPEQLAAFDLIYGEA